MIHTLLPDAERKALRREYRIRAAIVLCFMVSLAGVIGMAALFPAFMRASLEERSEAAAVAAIHAGTDSQAAAIGNRLSADSRLVSAAAAEGESTRFSSLVESVVSAAGSVSITSLSLSSVGTTSVSIAVQGVAPTRDELLSFKSRLEELAPGNAVDLPIDELTKSSDIQFSLTVTQTLP